MDQLNTNKFCAGSENNYSVKSAWSNQHFTENAHFKQHQSRFPLQILNPNTNLHFHQSQKCNQTPKANIIENPIVNEGHLIPAYPNLYQNLGQNTTTNTVNNSITKFTDDLNPNLPENELLFQNHIFHETKETTQNGYFLPVNPNIYYQRGDQRTTFQQPNPHQTAPSSNENCQQFEIQNWEESFPKSAKKNRPMASATSDSNLNFQTPSKLSQNFSAPLTGPWSLSVSGSGPTSSPVLNLDHSEDPIPTQFSSPSPTLKQTAVRVKRKYTRRKCTKNPNKISISSSKPNVDSISNSKNPKRIRKTPKRGTPKSKENETSIENKFSPRVKRPYKRRELKRSPSPALKLIPELLRQPEIPFLESEFKLPAQNCSVDPASNPLPAEDQDPTFVAKWTESSDHFKHGRYSDALRIAMGLFNRFKSIEAFESPEFLLTTTLLIKIYIRQDKMKDVIEFLLAIIKVVSGPKNHISFVRLISRLNLAYIRMHFGHFQVALTDLEFLIADIERCFTLKIGINEKFFNDDQILEIYHAKAALLMALGRLNESAEAYSKIRAELNRRNKSDTDQVSLLKAKVSILFSKRGDVEIANRGCDALLLYYGDKRMNKNCERIYEIAKFVKENCVEKMNEVEIRTKESLPGDFVDGLKEKGVNIFFGLTPTYWEYLHE